MPAPAGIPERRSGAATEALANSERLTRLIKVMVLVLALYVAVAVTIASVIGVQNALRSNENAKEGAAYALQALQQSRINTGIANDVRALVAAQAPCLPGDPPESPGCVRQARSDKIVSAAIADIKASLAAGLDVHDLNAKAAHDELLRQRGRTTTTARTPITSEPRTTVARTTTSQAPLIRPVPVPVATTTTCVPHKRERCR